MTFKDASFIDNWVEVVKAAGGRYSNAEALARSLDNRHMSAAETGLPYKTGFERKLSDVLSLVRDVSTKERERAYAVLLLFVGGTNLYRRLKDLSSPSDYPAISMVSETSKDIDVLRAFIQLADGRYLTKVSALLTSSPEAVTKTSESSFTPTNRGGVDVTGSKDHWSERLTYWNTQWAAQKDQIKKDLEALSDFIPYYSSVAAAMDVPEDTCLIMILERGWTGGVSSSGAKGVMQIMGGSSKGKYYVDKSNELDERANPYLSMAGAIRYFSTQAGRFTGPYQAASLAYIHNAGAAHIKTGYDTHDFPAIFDAEWDSYGDPSQGRNFAPKFQGLLNTIMKDPELSETYLGLLEREPAVKPVFVSAPVDGVIAQYASALQCTEEYFREINPHIDRVGGVVKKNDRMVVPVGSPELTSATLTLLTPGKTGAMTEVPITTTVVVPEKATRDEGKTGSTSSAAKETVAKATAGTTAAVSASEEFDWDTEEQRLLDEKIHQQNLERLRKESLMNVPDPFTPEEAAEYQKEIDDELKAREAAITVAVGAATVVVALWVFGFWQWLARKGYRKGIFPGICAKIAKSPSLLHWKSKLVIYDENGGNPIDGHILYDYLSLGNKLFGLDGTTCTPSDWDCRKTFHLQLREHNGHLYCHSYSRDGAETVYNFYNTAYREMFPLVMGGHKLIRAVDSIELSDLGIA